MAKNSVLQKKWPIASCGGARYAYIGGGGVDEYPQTELTPCLKELLLEQGSRWSTI